MRPKFYTICKPICKPIGQVMGASKGPPKELHGPPSNASGSLPRGSTQTNLGVRRQTTPTSPQRREALIRIRRRAAARYPAPPCKTKTAARYSGFHASGLILATVACGGTLPTVPCKSRGFNVGGVRQHATCASMQSQTFRLIDTGCAERAIPSREPSRGSYFPLLFRDV